MQTSTIKFSQIEDRIDAEYYKPEYLEVKEKLDKNKGIKFLGDIVNVIMNGVEFRTYSFSGKPYLRVSDIKEVFMDLSDVKYIPENIEFSKDIELLDDDVLTSRSGTLGISAIAPKAGSIISSHLIRISPKKEINSYYLVVFLNSKYGRLQILQKNNGAVVPEINQPSLKSLKIPIPPQSFQQKIEKIVKEAQKKRRLADEKYKEAEEILNKELGLKDLDLFTQKTFEAKFSETEDRFDPEYYQPKYKKIISKFKSQKSKLLSEIVKIRKGIEVGHEAYTNDGKPFIRVQDYDEKELIISGSTNYIRPYLYEELKKTHKPVVGVIIYSKDGTVGRAFVVSKDNHEFIVSGGILILTPRDVDNYYLALVLNSEIVHSQAIRKSIGAIIQHLSVEEVKKLQIPILPQSTQQKVSSLIQESFKLRQEAKELINRAKQKVEELIEK